MWWTQRWKSSSVRSVPLLPLFARFDSIWYLILCALLDYRWTRLAWGLAAESVLKRTTHIACRADLLCAAERLSLIHILTAFSSRSSFRIMISMKSTTSPKVRGPRRENEVLLFTQSTREFLRLIWIGVMFSFVNIFSKSPRGSFSSKRLDSLYPVLIGSINILNAKQSFSEDDNDKQLISCSRHWRLGNTPSTKMQGFDKSLSKAILSNRLIKYE